MRHLTSHQVASIKIRSFVGSLDAKLCRPSVPPQVQRARSPAATAVLARDVRHIILIGRSTRPAKRRKEEPTIVNTDYESIDVL